MAGSESLNRAARPLFVATILVGSFLLFLIQPMVARMALPRLGGAPNVWNSAMLVYQALLLAGYAWAHWLGRMRLRRQAMLHVALLALAALTLPVALADLPPSLPGWEPLWVPLLLLVSIGPVFLLVSAQAPLMQRWFAASPDAGEPWALYTASNLGSFAGLIAYPLLAEPLLSLRGQSAAWSAGYAVLVMLVLLCGLSRSRVSAVVASGDAAASTRIGTRRIVHWMALAAVPSGLMLSTTTHLTTDVFATPMLWVIPLGLYLLSFVPAFADRRGPALAVTWLAPPVVLLAGSHAMLSNGAGTLTLAAGSLAMLFVIAVSLHARMYDLRPGPQRLTLFYLAMSAGGAVGGLFTALLAPLLFDWVWEHPILVLAAAALMPLPELLRWRHMDGLEPGMARIALALMLAMAGFLGWQLYETAPGSSGSLWNVMLLVFLAGIGILVSGWRWAFGAVLLLAMLAQGGWQTVQTSLDGLRTRSYFGIYTIRDYPQLGMRMLSHGTTLHGQQSLDPARRRDVSSYYGATSGAGLAISALPSMVGPGAKVGVVGLGTGTLACLGRSDQHWTFFEIDPVVLSFSRPSRGEPRFTYLRDCQPGARVVLGDARLELEKLPPARFDLLAVDAFSSDAIPLHLLTSEAFGVYQRALAPGGVLLVHISNRYLDLEPQVAALAARQKMVALKRYDLPDDRTRLVPSLWIALAAAPSRIDQLARMQRDAPWEPLTVPAPRAWTDDRASILPTINWDKLLGS